MIGTAARGLQKAAFLMKHGGKVTLGKECRIPFGSLHVEANRLKIGDHVTLGERTVLKGDSFEFGDYFLSGNDIAITGQNARF